MSAKKYRFTSVPMTSILVHCIARVHLSERNDVLRNDESKSFDRYTYVRYFHVQKSKTDKSKPKHELSHTSLFRHFQLNWSKPKPTEIEMERWKHESSIFPFVFVHSYNSFFVLLFCVDFVPSLFIFVFSVWWIMEESEKKLGPVHKWTLISIKRQKLLCFRFRSNGLCARSQPDSSMFNIEHLICCAHWAQWI